MNGLRHKVVVLGGGAAGMMAAGAAAEAGAKVILVEQNDRLGNGGSAQEYPAQRPVSL